MYYLYVLECGDKTLYTGITVDVKRRVDEHNNSRRGAKYTRARRPVQLVYVRKFRSRSTAAQAEWRMKKMSRAEKGEIIKPRARRAGVIKGKKAGKKVLEKKTEKA